MKYDATRALAQLGRTAEVVVLEDGGIVEQCVLVAKELVLHESTPAVVEEVDVSIPSGDTSTGQGTPRGQGIRDSDISANSSSYSICT